MDIHEQSKIICNQVKELSGCNLSLLSFSRGKDSVCAWLAIRDHFERVIPFFCYGVPGLEFVEESLYYFERFFGSRIIRLPHPSLYRHLNNFTHQAPQNLSVIEQARLPVFDYADVHRIIREDYNLPKNCFTATGIKAIDSPMRQTAIRKRGFISQAVRQYYPVGHYKNSDIIAELKRAGARLPVDYRLFGRTFDGIDYRFLRPIKDNFPRDYQRILEFFPLADLELYRREHVGHTV